jgi:hypothetical protein
LIVARVALRIDRELLSPNARCHALDILYTIGPHGHALVLDGAFLDRALLDAHRYEYRPSSMERCHATYEG